MTTNTRRFMFRGPTGRIDVHSHLLPGVDDGCSSVEESLACARQMVEAGYTHSFCTPHIWPNLPNNNPTGIAQRVAQLQHDLDANQIPLQLLPGGELNMTPNTASLNLEEVVTYASLGTHLLIDLWAEKLPPFFEPAVRHLQSLGLNVILAHPERMRAVQEDHGLAVYFAELGVLLQCNLQCLGDPPHAATRILAEKWLAEDRYFMMGSDLHNLPSLPLRLKGLKRAIEAVGEEKVWKLTREHPRRLIAD
jgi:protein-tyrosine phosphatase